MTTYTLDVTGNMNLTGNLYFNNPENYINTVNGNAVQYVADTVHVFYDKIDNPTNKLFITGKEYTATLNKHVFENIVSIGSYSPPEGYKLYVEGNTYVKGNTTITNNTTGTLILNKTVSSGVSSIVFPSMTSLDDYGSIEYYDDVYNTNKNYFELIEQSESACLYIGSENDDNSLYSSFRDTIVIRPVGGLILDVGTYTNQTKNTITQNLSGTIFMVPNNSNVCIGSMTEHPEYKLFVEGNVATSGVLESSALYSSGDISFDGNLNLISFNPQISLTQDELSRLSGAKSNIQDQISNIQVQINAIPKANFEIVYYYITGKDGVLNKETQLKQNYQNNTNYAVFPSIYCGYNGNLGGTYSPSDTANTISNIAITYRSNESFNWTLIKSTNKNVNVFIVFLVVYGVNETTISEIPINYSDVVYS